MILVESHDQYPLIDMLMSARSSAEAVHVLLTGKPLEDGVPLSSNESTYAGAGFLVDLAGFCLDEDPGGSGIPGGSGRPGVAEGAEGTGVSDDESAEGLFLGLPSLGLGFITFAPSLSCATLQEDQWKV